MVHFNKLYDLCFFVFAILDGTGSPVGTKSRWLPVVPRESCETNQNPTNPSRFQFPIKRNSKSVQLLGGVRVKRIWDSAGRRGRTTTRRTLLCYGLIFYEDRSSAIATNAPRSSSTPRSFQGKVDAESSRNGSECLIFWRPRGRRQDDNKQRRF